MRAKPLIEKLENIGLVDIEYRDLHDLSLPPLEFFTAAEREICISGLSLHNTFLQNIGEIQAILKDGKRIYVMILHPESPALPKLQEIEERGIKGDIQATIDTIQLSKLCSDPLFKIRFFQDIPRFLGIMIDGDVTAPENAKKEDGKGQIRVKPYLQNTPNNRGLIIQLKKIKTTPMNPNVPFDDFAKDLRKQWLDAKEDPSLFYDIKSEEKLQVPVMILFLAANPSGMRLKLDQESREIDDALRKSDYGDRFFIQKHMAVRVKDLQNYLLRYKPNIVHFSGHGNQANQIILEDNSGISQPVATQALGNLFSVVKSNIRCVVLNACYTDQQARAVAEHIDCVIGMSNAIGDQAAINFSTAFYQALGFGENVKTAFELGCNQIDLEGLAEQDRPKLLSLRSDPSSIKFI